jgi:hypothetical protein
LCQKLLFLVLCPFFHLLKLHVWRVKIRAQSGAGVKLDECPVRFERKAVIGACVASHLRRLSQVVRWKDSQDGGEKSAILGMRFAKFFSASVCDL